MMVTTKISDLSETYPHDGFIEKETPAKYCDVCNKELVNPNELAAYGNEVLCDGVH